MPAATPCGGDNRIRRKVVDIDAAIAAAAARPYRYRIPWRRGTHMRRRIARGRWRKALKLMGFAKDSGAVADLARLVDKELKTKDIVWRWRQVTQEALCAPGGAGRLADAAAYASEF